MEPALRAVCKDVRIGKILIQTNLDSGEPEVAKMAHLVPLLFSTVFQNDIQLKRNVFLFFHMMLVSVVTT